MTYDYKKHIKPKRQLKNLEQVKVEPETPPTPQPTINETWINEQAIKLTKPESYYRVLVEISKGKPLSRAATGIGGVPSANQIRYAILKDEEFKKEYDIAMRLQCDAYADEMIVIADNLDKRGTYTKQLEDGTTTQMENVKQVERDRLGILTRQWLIARRLPKIYGDSIRQEISNDLQNVKPVINIIKA
jgi:hypothetical protein